MNEVQTYYVEYIKQYIKTLTGDKKEFFLSLCDIEEELLQELDVSSLNNYHVVVVDNKDYSQAVQLRNDINVSRIVLLSGEGIKQIDSLKDFNEYSVLSRNRKLLWNCLEQVFHVRFKENVKIFFEAILSQREISFWDFLQYLCRAGIRQGQINPKALNLNLPMLGIWKSKSDKVLGKGKVSKMIRLSRYGVIESRLTNAILNNKIQNAQKERLITNSLAQGSVQKILENIYFEDVEEFLKYAPKNAAESGADNNRPDDNAALEISNDFSYEFKLREHLDMDIREIEQEWLAGKGKGDAEETVIELNWDKYYPMVSDISEYIRQFEALEEQIRNLNISSSKMGEALKRLASLRSEFSAAWKDVIDITPICLYTFCEVSQKYSQCYFELLAFLVTDEKIRYTITKTGIIPSLQTLFCKVEVKEIKMPFYHPVCVFYYMGICKMYEYALQKPNSADPIKMDILDALIHKLGMQFPIDFLELEEQLYALDYTTIWKSGAIIFQNMEEGIVYSSLDFRVLQKEIIEYIGKHPFLTEITIAIIDISNLGGLIQLIDRIRQISQGSYCNIGCITFLILSSKEEELKNALSQMWDVIGTNNIVRFRFGRSSYRIKNQNGRLQYDIQRIVDDADMIIIADGSVLYHDPRMVKLQTGENTILNRIEQINLTSQVDNYFRWGKSDIPILWNTLQRIAYSWEDGLWVRKSKEIDNGILTYINQTVSQNADKRIVALSSNEHILSEIFKINYMHAHRQKYNGKSITLIQFDKENHIKKFPMNGKCEITYFINDFYNATLELENFSQKILPDISDISLQIYYENGIFNCNCNVYKEDWEEDERYCSETCNNFLQWQMGNFLNEENILSRYLCELLINQWYEKTESIPAVLMVEKLYHGYTIKPHYFIKEDEEQEISNKEKYVSDCIEAFKIHDIVRFTQEKEVIDEYTVSQFREQFEISMLDRIVECDNKQQLLGTPEKNKLLEIQEKVKEK